MQVEISEQEILDLIAIECPKKKPWSDSCKCGSCVGGLRPTVFGEKLARIFQFVLERMGEK